MEGLLHWTQAGHFQSSNSKCPPSQLNHACQSANSGTLASGLPIMWAIMKNTVHPYNVQISRPHDLSSAFSSPIGMTSHTTEFEPVSSPLKGWYDLTG